MPRKAHSEDPEDPPSEINPYDVLGVDSKATSDQVKSAYRKQALKHHPDKASAEDKDTSHKRFQEIAFAYAILSDERRRKRYDATGNTAESLDVDDDDFNWLDFFREQKAAVVDGGMIEMVRKEYQGSEEERGDVLAAYEENEGDMDAVYERVMCSDVLVDDKRFRGIIDGAIEEGEVQGYTRYVKESKASRRRRREQAGREGVEAMELAEELGVREQLFGNGSGKGDGGGGAGVGGKKSKDRKGGGEDALKALIQQRQNGRQSLFEKIEAKYAGGAGGKKTKKRVMDEPPEEAFQKNAKKGKKATA